MGIRKSANAAAARLSASDPRCAKGHMANPRFIGEMFI